MPSLLAPFVWMFVSANLFATMNLFAKLASAEMHWSVVGLCRASTGAIIAWTVGRARGHRLRTLAPRAMWLRSGLGTASMLATFYALSRRDLPLSDAVTIFNLSPICTALLAPWLLGEPRDRSALAAAFIGAMGVVLIVRPAFLFSGGASTAAPIAVVAAVSSAMLSGVAFLALRRVGQTESVEAISLHFSLTAAFTMLVISATSFTMPSPRAAMLMLLAGLCGGAAQLALTFAYAHENAARIAPVGYFAVVTSSALGIFVLGERLTLLQVSGMSLVVLGGLIVARRAILSVRVRV